MNVKRLYIILLFALLVMSVKAQNANYYNCDFENTIVNSGWVLNSGPMGNSIANRWYIGSAVQNGGRNSLYISYNNGDSAQYTNSANCAVAYTTLNMEPGEYTFSFDWMAKGNSTAGTDGLYVCIVPLEDEDGEIRINTVPSSGLPDWAKIYPLILDNYTKAEYLYNSSVWRNVNTKIKIEKSTDRLVFLWRNGTSFARNPGACVDNILIVNPDECVAPTKLRIEESGQDLGLRLTWNGSADDKYEIITHNYITKTRNVYVVQDSTFVISSPEEGMTTFSVRKICGTDNYGQTLYSVPATAERLVYIVAQHCLDYLTLTDDNCFINTDETKTKPTNTVQFTKGMVDAGAETYLSRHTKCIEPNEYDYYTIDPLTGVGLKTIPDGEIASIRLGNAFRGGESERLEFEFEVDTLVNPLVLLKYAVIFEDPGASHSYYQQPRFSLQVLRSDRSALDLDDVQCNGADFTFEDATEKPEDWHIIPGNTYARPGDDTGMPGEGQTISSEIWWRDWTQVGVNLKKYHGQKVLVQLTTYDCSQSGHFGYAYFVLKCSKGELDGQSCGMQNPVFKAPDGFDYRWYLESDQATIRANAKNNTWDESLIKGRKQTMEVSTTDTLHYAVDCIFAGDTACYFTLYASSLARFPRAEGSVKLVREDCLNKLYFESTSHMVEYNHVSGHTEHTARMVDYVFWDFGNGDIVYQENPPMRIFPAEGGKFTAWLHAVYQTCEDSLLFEIDVPYTGVTFDSIAQIGCDGTSYQAQYVGADGTEISKFYFASGTYLDTVQSSIGCDSVFVLELDMRETKYTEIDRTILNNQTYTFHTERGDRELNQTGVYKAYLQSHYGCDSIVTLNLYVHERLLVDMQRTIDVCADELSVPLQYTFTSGRTNTYSVVSEKPTFPTIERTALPNLSLDEVTGEFMFPIEQPAVPDIYPLEFTFYDSISGNVIIPVSLVIHYSDTILVQMWNDVIAIRDSTNNGGYVFTSYQWYKGGELIEGATGPYLYIDKGELEMDSVPYCVALSREGTTAVTSCPIYPTPHYDQFAFPSIVSVGQRQMARLPMSAVVSFYTVSGLCWSREAVKEGRSEVSVPSLQGIYVMIIEYADGSRQHQKVFVR